MPDQAQRPDEPPIWTPAAQWTMAGLVALALGLASWNAVGRRPWAPDGMPLRKGVVPLAPIDLNTADEDRLATLPGVGPALAKRIADHRRAYGPFPNVAALRLVPGIGPATLERLRPFLHVAGQGELPVAIIRGTRPDEAPGTGRKPPPEGKIDINTATEEQVQKLPGVGPVLAGRIVEARKKEPFRTVDDLRRVKGIGPKTLEKIRPHVEIGR